MDLEALLRVLRAQRFTRTRMNSRFYVTATVALLLAAAYNGAAKRSEPASASSPASVHSAEGQSAQPTVPVTARSLTLPQQVALPRS
jgi:hypothetical protein